MLPGFEEIPVVAPEDRPKQRTVRYYLRCLLPASEHVTGGWYVYHHPTRDGYKWLREADLGGRKPKFYKREHTAREALRRTTPKIAEQREIKVWTET